MTRPVCPNASPWDFPPFSPEKQRRRLLLLIAFPVLLAVLAWAVWWWYEGRLVVTTSDAYVQGNIIPVQNLTLGTLHRVLAEDTEYVRAGQVLAELQGSRARLRLRHREATLGAVVRGVRRDFARVLQLHYAEAAQEARLQKLAMDLRHYRKSLPGGAIPLLRVVNTRQNLRAARAEMAATRAAMQAAASLVSGTTVAGNPLVRRAAAALENADIRWQRRLIRAPVAGYLTRRTADPGLVVHPGENLFSIVPLGHLWVVANVRETDMAQVRPGQPVTLTSDYYGSRVCYHGVVEGLTPGAGSAFSILPPENSTGNYIHIVERVPVRISLPRRELQVHPLRPGLSMVVHIRLRPSGRSVLQPLTATPVRDYVTEIHIRELRKAEKLAAGIIRANS